MFQSLAVLMSVLVAMSAQAQDASTTESEGKPAPAARSPKAKRRRPAIASKAQPVESARPVLQPSAPQAKPDAGVDASTPLEPPLCGMRQWIISDEPASAAVRFYPAGTAVASPQEAGHRTWESPPRVWKAGRCLDKYFIQLKSSSEEPWELKDATLVGADGEVLKVTDVRWRLGLNNQSINAIEVEKTKGGAKPNYRLVTFVLVGKDGRVAILQNLELP